MAYDMDDIDRALLQFLQTNARVTSAELARRVDLSPPGLQKRIRRLEDSGVISRYTAILDREQIGYDMLCFVQVNLQRHEVDVVENFKRVVQTMPEVLECHHVTGEYDYLLKVIVRNRKHLEQFILQTLTPVKGMDKIRTSLALSEIKATTELPVDKESLC